ncbi:MAG: HD domain-containing phosphohydrolase [Acidobacteriota bacterium]
MSGTFPIGMLEETPGSVLVVDDDAQVRALLVALLKPRGYVTRTAGSAEEAQEQLKAFRPDVILLDLHLPGRSGQDVLAELRAAPVTRLLPVIMITGGATGEERLRAMAGGVTDFVKKPWASEELLARIRSLVQMKRFTDALEHAEHVIVALAHAIDARDPYTAQHSERVSVYAGRLGAKIGLTGFELEAVKRGGLFHDIGKIAIRDAVLLKPSRLTPEEMAEIRKHPVVGRELLSGMKTLSFALDVVYGHHERIDGSGYPEGLSGESIPLTARVTTIADIYDALTTARVYRAALTRTEALAIMAEEARRGWWDLRLLDTFRGVLESIPEDVSLVTNDSPAPL